MGGMGGMEEFEDSDDELNAFVIQVSRIAFEMLKETANSGDKKDEAAKEEAKAEELTTSAKEDK
ncbi:hypothetical protein F2Q70_00005590 [Brassica cretica]|uniref:Uncharacterized protein n=1 Tax=Brassica cretica TaxID=69181 RepID=A0A8S9J297_BRACR|nr:hypothetical protein F2Q70_00005590 [Brassica cretica]KAF3560576.1 hypothetical protein DY000_02018098 [Brassica cretica]